MEPGAPLIFCRRDAESAVSDLERMCRALKGSIDSTGGTPKGAVYFTCLARGPNLFGPDSEELRCISSVLGEIPLVGFFGNGEISHDRLYGYTGVLTVFM